MTSSFSADARLRRQSGVRTFTPRWRNSPLTEERMARYLPTRGIPDGPFLPAVVYGRTAPVVLEVGSGHGAAAIAYAAAHPSHDVLAVDVHRPGIARMLAAAEAAGVPNLRAWEGDALTLLEEGVAPGTFTAVHLFFPDPWPKARHAKRRFVSAYSLDLIASRLASGGVLRIATDKEGYAEHALGELARHGGYAVTTGDRPPWRPTDGFEDKGVAAGRVITEITATAGASH